jgi:hypothetical protein
MIEVPLLADERDRVGQLARREQLQLELRLIEGELRTDEALRLQEEAARERVGERRLVAGRWRAWR